MDIDEDGCLSGDEIYDMIYWIKMIFRKKTHLFPLKVNIYFLKLFQKINYFILQTILKY
jgi:hypothetical protein